ncbi:hypothetical protein DYB30_007699 [Aphanomyces astaci]|uniref:Uncharacterized protein n=1 Tax=Aphanomyces astaci TaxID=112090 RepID=A0A397EGV0_APHAT|nr:hypothetical protein DYB30_007699 [Aphanomyces astaci]
MSCVTECRYGTQVLATFGGGGPLLFVLIGQECGGVDRRELLTNRAIARLAGDPMIDCVSHSYNLFIGDVLEEHKDLLVAVNAIMKKLINIIPSAKFRCFTHFQPMQRN